MSISLIVTNSIDQDFNETGDEIECDDWHHFIESDPALNLRNEPFTVTAPNGSVVSMAPLEGQA